MEKVLDFVAVDFETLQGTTLRGTECLRMPIQIGMVKYLDGQPAGDAQVCYIDPPVAKPWKAYYKIGITSDHCEGAKTFEELYPWMLDFTCGLPLVAFSRSTEVNAFREACAYYGLENHFPEARFIDPYSQCLAAYRHPTPKSKSDSGLRYWYEHFALGDEGSNQHDAGADAVMCARLYLHLQTLDLDALLERHPMPLWEKEKKDKTLFGDPVAEADVQHPDNPLNRRYVCLTGFDAAVENALNRKLAMLGAGRHDNVLAQTDVLIPSRQYLEKEYGTAPTGKLAKAIAKGKHVMSADELKEMLLLCGMYGGELDE